MPWTFRDGAHNLPDADVRLFQRWMKAAHNEELSETDATFRYCEILSLYWMLAHKAPEPGEAPAEPPAPPWTKSDQITQEYLDLRLILFHPSAYMKKRPEIFDGLSYKDLDDAKKAELAKRLHPESQAPDTPPQPAL